MTEKSNYQLDDEAQELFNELNTDSESPPRATPAYSLSMDETELDAWRALLIEAVHLIASHIVEKLLLEGIKKEKTSIARLGALFGKILDSPFDANVIRVCHRGFASSASRSGELDYELVFGDIMIDLSVARSMAKRMGVRMSHLDKRLKKAFEVFSNHAINSLDIRLPDPDSTRQMEAFRFCLLILARYDQASKMNGPIRIEQDGQAKKIPLIQNHLRQYDPNLTILAGLNRLSASAMEKLVKSTQEAAEKGDISLKDGIYYAIITARKSQKKLQRLPIEVNASQYEIVRADRKRREAARADGGFPTETSGEEKENSGDSAEEIEEMLAEEPTDRLTQLIRKNFENDPQSAQGMIKGERLQTDQCATVSQSYFPRQSPYGCT